MVFTYLHADKYIHNEIDYISIFRRIYSIPSNNDTCIFKHANSIELNEI